MYRILVLMLIAVTTIARLLFISKVNLFVDEATWWFAAKHIENFNISGIHMALHPPLTVLIIKLFTWIGGDSEFFIRIGFVLFFAFSTFLTYLLNKDIFKSDAAGFYSALLLNIIPLFSIVGGTFASPKSLEIFFCALTLFFIFKCVKYEKLIWWIFLGITLGLGSITIYSTFLLLPVFLIFLFSSKKNKKWFLKKRLYLTCGIATMIFFPHLIWNIKNSYNNFLCVYSRLFLPLLDSPWHYNFLRTVRWHLSWLSPPFFIALLSAIPIGGYLAIKRREEGLWLLFLCAAINLAVHLVIFLLTGKIYPPDWMMMTYLPAVGIVVYLWQRLCTVLKRKRILFASLGVLSCAIGLMFSIILCLSITIPVCYKFYFIEKKPIDGFFGWPELAKYIKERYASTVSEKMYLSSDNYGIACEGAFYLQKSSPPPLYLDSFGIIYKIPAARQERYQSFLHYATFSKQKKCVTASLEDELPTGSDFIYFSNKPISQRYLLYFKERFKDILEEPSLTIPAISSSTPLKTFFVYRCYAK